MLMSKSFKKSAGICRRADLYRTPIVFGGENDGFLRMFPPTQLKQWCCCFSCFMQFHSKTYRNSTPFHSIRQGVFDPRWIHLSAVHEIGRPPSIGRLVYSFFRQSLQWFQRLDGTDPKMSFQMGVHLLGDCAIYS